MHRCETKTYFIIGKVIPTPYIHSQPDIPNLYLTVVKESVINTNSKINIFTVRPTKAYYYESNMPNVIN